MAKAKIHIVIADRDELYLNHMTNYMMEKEPQFEIFAFSNEDSLYRFLEGEQKVDILLLDFQTMDMDRAAGVQVPLKMIMSAEEEAETGFISVKKFQKTENLINEILFKYAEATGKTESVKGSHQTKLAAFYSPVGGSGVTTLALSTALVAAAQGIRTCYLNLEDIDSTGGILPQTPGRMSDVYLALKVKSANVGLKFRSCCGREPNTGLVYITGPGSLTDMMDVTGEDFQRLLEEIERLGEYDLLVLDLGSGFNEEKICMLKQCDCILMPVVADKLAIRKIQMLYHEEELHDQFHSIIERIQLIINKTDMTGISPMIQSSDIFNHRPGVAAIAFSSVFMDAEKLPYAVQSLVPVFEPVICAIRQN